MIGFGEQEHQRDQRREPDEPHPRRHRGHRPAAVERHHRQQVEQVQEEARVRERAPQVVAGDLPDEDADGRADAAEDGAGESDTRFRGGVVAERARGDTAPRNGMNIGALALRPSRRSAITWPISCTNSSAMKPAANGQPQIHAYAASETGSCRPTRTASALGSSTRMALNFAKNSGEGAAPMRRHRRLIRRLP